MSGREVSNYALYIHLDAARRTGLDVDAVLDGLQVTMSGLHNLRGRHSWEDYSTAMRRLMKASGGPEAFGRIGADSIVRNPALRMFAGLVLSPQDLYLHVAPRVIRKMYEVVRIRVQRSDSDILMEEWIPEPYSSVTGLWVVTTETFRRYPRMLGLPDAIVEAEFAPRRCVMKITPPASRTLPARVSKTLALPLRRLRDLVRDSRDDDEGTDGLAAFFDDSHLVRIGQKCGQELAQFDDLRLLCDKLFSIMDERFGYREIALWSVRPVTGEATLLRSTLPEEAGMRLCPLVVAGSEIGRLGVRLEPGHAGIDPSIDAMLPWLALGLDNCMTRPDGKSVDPSQRAQQWGLTAREREVLMLAVRGHANKEIALALDCTVKGVEKHMTSVFRKAGVDSRTMLMARCLAPPSSGTSPVRPHTTR